MRYREFLREGGKAVQEAGPIHISEINPTFESLSQVVGIPYEELRGNSLGSVGKAEWSGDIDIALDNSKHDLDELYNRLAHSGITDIKKMPGLGVVSFGFPIRNYDYSKQHPEKERTGKVQVDFMLGNNKWLKFSFHSAGDASKYKGIYRAILLATTAAAMSQTYFDPKTEELIGRFGPMLAPAQGMNIKAKIRQRKPLTKKDIQQGKSPDSQPYKKGEDVITPEEFKQMFPDADIDKFGNKFKLDDPLEVVRFLFADVKPDVTPDDVDSVEDILQLLVLKPKDFQKLVLSRFKERLATSGLSFKE